MSDDEMNEGISIKLSDWRAVVGFLIKHSGKIRSPNVFRHFEKDFNEDFTKNKLHDMLQYLNECGNMKFDDGGYIIWLGKNMEMLK